MNNTNLRICNIYIAVEDSNLGLNSFSITIFLLNLRAYTFGHLKSAKSSENGRLRRETFQLP